MPARQTPAEEILSNFQGTGRERCAIPEHKDLTFPLKQQRAAVLSSNFFACDFLSVFIAGVQLGGEESPSLPGWWKPLPS